MQEAHIAKKASRECAGFLEGSGECRPVVSFSPNHPRVGTHTVQTGLDLFPVGEELLPGRLKSAVEDSEEFQGIRGEDALAAFGHGDSNGDSSGHIEVFFLVDTGLCVGLLGRIKDGYLSTYQLRSSTA